MMRNSALHIGIIDGLVKVGENYMSFLCIVQSVHEGATAFFSYTGTLKQTTVIN